MSYWGAIAEIAGWLTLGGTASVILIGVGIWLKQQVLIWAGIAVVASTFSYGVGVSHEKVVCDARFVAAHEAFQKFVDDVAKHAKETADKLTTELADKDKLIDKWTDDYEKLEKAKTVGACALTDADLRSMR